MATADAPKSVKLFPTLVYENKTSKTGSNVLTTSSKDMWQSTGPSCVRSFSCPCCFLFLFAFVLRHFSPASVTRPWSLIYVLFFCIPLMLCFCDLCCPFLQIVLELPEESAITSLTISGNIVGYVTTPHAIIICAPLQGNVSRSTVCALSSMRAVYI